MRCPRCAAENPAGMRFCGQCGSPLAVGGGSAAGGELKQVSVLFCDIVGSTALTERLGAEAMRDLVARFLDLSTGEVRRLDGVVPQFRGDGFMAVFGAPQTQEDHARRALFAALAIRRGLGGEPSDGEPGALDLPVRIGIHSGPVVFGPVGGGFTIETVIGDTPNIAARLQEAAEPGTVVISDATRALAQGYARTQPLGPLAVRGRSEPVSAHRLVGISRSHARDAVAPSRTTPFIGRTDEIAALIGFVEEAEAGSGLAVGIVGEPGIGKTRLLDELRHRLGARRVTWTEGRCLSYGAAIPYLMLLDLLRSNCGIGEADTPETIARKLRWSLRVVGIDPDEDAPLLLRLLGVKTGDAPPPLPPEIVKQRAFEVFRRLAVNGSRRRPLILVLEDLHWADAMSAEFAGMLAEEIAGTRILILATWRPGHLPPWAGKPAARQIALQPLGRSDSFDLLYSVLPSAGPADPVTSEIIARADGNPLFLEQLALHTGEAKERRLELMVPATIHDVVMARIDRLPEEAKRLLQTAAVVGREFPLRLVRAVWDGDTSPDWALRELCRLEFLDEWPDDEATTYVFRHALTQEAAYGSLLERDRRRRHEAVGQALETLYAGRTDEVAELLALHFGHSAKAEKATDYAIAAAEKSQRRWANAEALAYFNDALHRLDALPDTQPNRLRKIDAVLKQVEVKFALGRQAEHLTALENIRNAVEVADDPRRCATWHCWTGYLHGLTGGSAALAIAHCREAAAIAAAHRCEDIEGFIYSCAVQSYVFGGELRAAIESGDRAVAILERQGDLWWASRTLWNTAQAAIYLGKWEAALAYCHRVLAHARALDERRLKVVGLYRLGSAYIFQGDIEQGLRCCEEALTLKPLPFDIAMAKVFHGYGEIKAGRLDAGIAELAEAVAWFDQSHLHHVRVTPALRLAEGYIYRGEIANARLLIDEALTASQEKGYYYVEGLARHLLAECLVVESPADAINHLAEAQRIFEAVGAQNDLAHSLVTRAKLSKCNPSEARGLLEDAAAIFKALGTLGEPDRVGAALAALDRACPN